MQFSIQREPLLNLFQQLSGIVEKRQTLPILSNALLTVSEGQLALTGTDMEATLATHVALADDMITEAGTITVPVKKLIDICRNLPDAATLKLFHHDNQLNIHCQRARFQVATLPTSDFPNDNEVTLAGPEVQVNQQVLKKAFQQSHFAIAQQDVRTYLNGLLIELRDNEFRAIASDGHRLALSRFTMTESQPQIHKVIIPRKAVVELLRLLDQDEENIRIQIGTHGVRFQAGEFDMITKLVEGPYPNYDSLIPQNSPKQAAVERETFKQVLLRAAIVSNDQFRTVRLQFNTNQLIIEAENNDRERVYEELEVDYSGDTVEIGLNVNYLLDVVNHSHSKTLLIEFSDPNASVLMRELDDDSHVYVVMPLCI